MSDSCTHPDGVVEVFFLPVYLELHPDADLATCGTCHRVWDDAVVTGWTPAPSGRCPFEHEHEEEEEPEEEEDPLFEYEHGYKAGFNTALSIILELVEKNASIYVIGEFAKHAKFAE